MNDNFLASWSQQARRKGQLYRGSFRLLVNLHTTRMKEPFFNEVIHDDEALFTVSHDVADRYMLPGTSFYDNLRDCHLADGEIPQRSLGPFPKR